VLPNLSVILLASAGMAPLSARRRATHDRTATLACPPHRPRSRTGAQPAPRSSGGRDELTLVPSLNCQIVNRRNCQSLARRCQALAFGARHGV
jgi:hypothetical protein